MGAGRGGRIKYRIREGPFGEGVRRGGIGGVREGSGRGQGGVREGPLGSGRGQGGVREGPLGSGRGQGGAVGVREG